MIKKQELLSFSAPVLWGRAWLKVVRALQDRWVLEACSVCMRSTRAAPGLQRGSTAAVWVPSSVQSHPFRVEETLLQLTCCCGSDKEKEGTAMCKAQLGDI